MNLSEVIETILNPSLAQLPAKMDSAKARVMLLAIGQQESRFEYRRQLGDGPARGFWQFELGTRASKGGVWGVYLHMLSAKPLADLCTLHKIECAPEPIWRALEKNDVFACGVARLMLWTDSQALPAIGDVDGAWNTYAVRVWRPGKPHRSTWNDFYNKAVEAIT
jgi:hypothetical protein